MRALMIVKAQDVLALTAALPYKGDLCHCLLVTVMLSKVTARLQWKGGRVTTQVSRQCGPRERPDPTLAANTFWHIGIWRRPVSLRLLGIHIPTLSHDVLFGSQLLTNHVDFMLGTHLFRQRPCLIIVFKSGRLDYPISNKPSSF